MAVVLFTDLVGSTELRGRLGEEAADELRRKHDQLLAQAVEASNGSVVKGLGDGIMATFAGASDAVAAAVAIQQAVDRLNRSGKAPVPLLVRVGLSAGDVSFEDVERQAHEGKHWGEIAGQPDAEALALAALFYVRMLQGRFDEAMQIMRPLAERFSGAMVYPMALAWACAEAGAVEEARRIVRRVRGESFGALRRASAAEELYDLLRPYHLMIATGQAVWFGPVAYDLGCLASSLGRYTEADAHFVQAVEMHERIGVRGVLAHTYLDWGRMLLSRSQTGDTDRARELLGQAVAAARGLGLSNVEGRAVALLGECP